MIGAIEQILLKRYGEPEIGLCVSGSVHIWNPEVENLRCVLYKNLVWDQDLVKTFGVLADIYGNALGGSLLWQSLNIAMLSGPKVFGIYHIEELLSTPAIVCAREQDPDVQFFMDSANVWYYGVKGTNLYVYDSSFDQLDLLGPVHREVERLLEEWEHAIHGNQDHTGGGPKSRI